jgi:hypothetical protein
MAEQGQVEAATRWDVRGRALFPVMYLVCLGYLFLDALVLQGR